MSKMSIESKQLSQHVTDVGVWFFHYRYGIVADIDDRRRIVPDVHAAILEHLKRIDTVIDQKGNMVLVTYKGARIR